MIDGNDYLYILISAIMALTQPIDVIINFIVDCRPFVVEVLSLTLSPREMGKTFMRNNSDMKACIGEFNRLICFLVESFFFFLLLMRRSKFVVLYCQHGEIESKIEKLCDLGK